MGRGKKRTGSVLLGEELKRLRGTRSLELVGEISRSAPYNEHLKSIAAPTLCQIEQGISMPSLESLYTLSVLYQVSTQHLLARLVDERLSKRYRAPDGLEATASAFAQALKAGRWYEALALAVHGERLASSRKECVRWRAHRAISMQMIGMRQEAIILMQECVADRALDRKHRCQVRRNLADMLASAGLYEDAEDSMRRAIELAGDDAPPAILADMLSTRARLVILQAEMGIVTEEPRLREAIRLVESARQHVPAEDAWNRGLFDLYEARATELLDNQPAAAASYARIAKGARGSELPRLELLALLNLGSLRRQLGKHADAEKHLIAAESLALDLKQPEECFEVFFELYLLYSERGDEKEATFYMKKCRRYHAMVRARTPNVMRFAELVGDAP
jgi:tetratricopeptide (TPR) repeat protein